MANEKMTKKDYFNAIKAQVSDNADLVAFIDHELELLSKKYSKSGGETKTQKANKENRDFLIGILSKYDSPVRVSDILKDDEVIAYTYEDGKHFSSSKITALLGQLKKSNEVVRTEEKGNAYYSLA